MEHPKDVLCDYLAQFLPDRLVLWVIVRAYAWTSTHECANKDVDAIGYSDIWHSWNNKIQGKTLVAEPSEEKNAMQKEEGE